MTKFRNGSILLMLVALWGCSDAGNNSIILDSASKHPADWIVPATGGLHPAAYAANKSACVECHGSAQNSQSTGGTSGISCFSASYNGIGCHPNGPGHPTGWHEITAKAAVGVSSGMDSCKRCHGADFGGGIAGVSCMKCHTKSPHALPWLGTTGATTHKHSTVDASNALACGRCHAGGVKLTTPITPPADAGCFNSTLCHGTVAPSHSLPYPGSSHLGTANGTGCLTCHLQGNDSSIYPTPSGTAPNCRGCHLEANPGTTPQCSDCHGSVANDKAGALKAGRPVGGATFPNIPGKHNIDDHSGIKCTYCHPFTSGDTRHGWSNRAERSKVAQVGGTGTLITTWVPATKSCTTACHKSTSEIREW